LAKLIIRLIGVGLAPSTQTVGSLLSDDPWPVIEKPLASKAGRENDLSKAPMDLMNPPPPNKRNFYITIFPIKAGTHVGLLLASSAK